MKSSLFFNSLSLLCSLLQKKNCSSVKCDFSGTSLVDEQNDFSIFTFLQNDSKDKQKKNNRLWSPKVLFVATKNCRREIFKLFLLLSCFNQKFYCFAGQNHSGNGRNKRNTGRSCFAARVLFFGIHARLHGLFFGIHHF